MLNNPVSHATFNINDGNNNERGGQKVRISKAKVTAARMPLLEKCCFAFLAVESACISKSVSGTKEETLKSNLYLIPFNDCIHCHLLLRLTERELRLAAGS